MKLFMCVHAAYGLLGVCGRIGGCALGGRRRAARARVEVDDERELETALLLSVDTLFEVGDAPAEANERCDQPSGQTASCERYKSQGPS